MMQPSNDAAAWQRAKVRATQDAAEGVRVLKLEPEGGASTYPLGSHINVEVQLADRKDKRSYSLVGRTPSDGAFVIAVKRVPESRGGSRYMWSLKTGDTVRISEPRSHFELGHGAPEYLLLAGGIGITPLVGMAEYLQRRGASFHLLYAGRKRSEMAFLDRLQTLLGPRLKISVDDEGGQPDLQSEIASLHPQGEIYVCGPIGMMEAAQRIWAEAGRHSTRCRLETFGSSGHMATEPFVARVSDRGLVLAVQRDQSLFDALTAQGVPMAGHCRRGECGLCAVDVLEVDGALDHRDVFLSSEEKATGRRMCTCVSRATGTITIDTGYRDLSP